MIIVLKFKIHFLRNVTNPLINYELHDGKFHLKNSLIPSTKLWAGVHWTDIIMSTPPQKKRFSTEKNRTEHYWQNDVCILKYVYTRNIVAEFYTWKIKRGKVLY